MPDLVWFRNDLRTTDNPALSAALRTSPQGVVGLFVCTPGTWRRHDWGPPRVAFVLESLRALRAELDRLRIPLLIRTVDSELEAAEAVADVAAAHTCTCVHANREFGVDETRRDEHARRGLQDRSIDFRLHADQVVLSPDEIRTGSGTSYRVFTPFRSAWNRIFATVPLPPVSRAEPAGATGIQSDPIPDSVDGFPGWPSITLWPAGTQAAMERLTAFLDGPVDHYQTARDIPSCPGTSTLSHWLAVGAISPVTCRQSSCVRIPCSRAKRSRNWRCVSWLVQ